MPVLDAPSTPSPQGDKVRSHFEGVADRYASWYEGASSEAHSFTTRLRRVLEMLPARPGACVDLGCGPGLLFARWLERATAGDRVEARLIGMDVADNMLRQAQQLVQSNRVAWIHGSAEALPFQAGRVDTAVCMGLMEYLDDEPRTMRELARVIRPDGLVVITLPNRWSPYRLWHRALNRLFTVLRALFPRSRRLQEVEFMVGPFTKGVAHREYSAWAYARWLRHFGFVPLDVCGYNFKLFLSPLDKWCPGLTVAVSRRLECLGRIPGLRCLATAFVIKAKRVTDACGTV